MNSILIFLAGIRFFDIGLTYDDGPIKKSYKLIDYLYGENIQAMFFPVGLRILNNKKYLPLLIIKNHEVGNHTYSHLELDNIKEKQVRQEFLKQHELLMTYGLKVKFFRYPSGKKSKHIASLLKTQNYKGVADWDYFTGDIFHKSDEGIIRSFKYKINRFINENKFDMIVLLHDCSPGVLRRTKKIIEFIKFKNKEASLLDKNVVLFRFSSPSEIFSRRLKNE